MVSGNTKHYSWPAAACCCAGMHVPVGVREKAVRKILTIASTVAGYGTPRAERRSRPLIVSVSPASPLP
jgi:hypothetical protein